MGRITNFTEANQALTPFIPLAREMTGKDITLQRMESMMERLGSPQDHLRVIHIAGTSGKTSTTYYIAAQLAAAGYTVGSTVSPHVDCINERLQVNGQPVTEAVFCQALEEFLALIEDVTPAPSYFELLVAFVYWYFAKTGVDYAVIETGLGGLHDATNVVQRADKICVLTDMGFDHMHVLGDTLPEITAQKAGIIHPGNTVFMYTQSEEVMSVVRQRAVAQKATLHELDESTKVFAASLQSLPIFQQRNWLLAYNAGSFVLSRDGHEALTLSQAEQSMCTIVPARMETRSVGDKTLVMDGAHNGQKMKMLVESFQARYPGVKPAILVAMKQSKDYGPALDALLPIAQRIIITSFEALQDLPASAIDPEELAAYCRRRGFQSVTVDANCIEAYRLLLDGPEPVMLVTGSLYLFGTLRPLFEAAS